MNFTRLLYENLYVVSNKQDFQGLKFMNELHSYIYIYFNAFNGFSTISREQKRCNILIYYRFKELSADLSATVSCSL